MSKTSRIFWDAILVAHRKANVDARFGFVFKDMCFSTKKTAMDVNNHNKRIQVSLFSLNGVDLIDILYNKIGHI